MLKTLRRFDFLQGQFLTIASVSHQVRETGQPHFLPGLLSFCFALFLKREQPTRSILSNADHECNYSSIFFSAIVLFLVCMQTTILSSSMTKSKFQGNVGKKLRNYLFMGLLPPPSTPFITEFISTERSFMIASWYILLPISMISSSTSSSV